MSTRKETIVGIESTKKVYLDGVCYIRAFEKDTDYFCDVVSSDYDYWLSIAVEEQIPFFHRR